MKTLMKFCFSLFLTGVVIPSVYGQKFDHAAGLRSGDRHGITYKYFLKEQEAIETFLGHYHSGLQSYVLYEWYNPMKLSFLKNLFWYYGAGGHLGYTRHHTEQYYYVNESEILRSDSKKSYFSMGFDGIIGLEYRIYEVPLTVGIESIPIMDFYGLQSVKFQSVNFNASIRYIF